MNYIYILCAAIILLALLLIVTNSNIICGILLSVGAIVCMVVHRIPVQTHTKPKYFTRQVYRPPKPYVGGATTSSGKGLYLGHNSCYINAPAQMLYSIPELREYILTPHISENKYRFPKTAYGDYIISNVANYHEGPPVCRFWTTDDMFGLGQLIALYNIFYSLQTRAGPIIWSGSRDTSEDNYIQHKWHPEYSGLPYWLRQTDMLGWEYNRNTDRYLRETHEQHTCDISVLIRAIGPISVYLFRIVRKPVSTQCIYNTRQHMEQYCESVYNLEVNIGGTYWKPSRMVVDTSMPCLLCRVSGDPYNCDSKNITPDAKYTELPLYLLASVKRPDYEHDVEHWNGPATDQTYPEVISPVLTLQENNITVAYTLKGVILRTGDTGARGHYTYTEMSDDGTSPNFVYNDRKVVDVGTVDANMRKIYKENIHQYAHILLYKRNNSRDAGRSAVMDHNEVHTLQNPYNCHGYQQSELNKCDGIIRQYVESTQKHFQEGSATLQAKWNWYIKYIEHADIVDNPDSTSFNSRSNWVAYSTATQLLPIIRENRNNPEVQRINPYPSYSPREGKQEVSTSATKYPYKILPSAPPLPPVSRPLPPVPRPLPPVPNQPQDNHIEEKEQKLLELFLTLDEMYNYKRTIDGDIAILTSESKNNSNDYAIKTFKELLKQTNDRIKDLQTQIQTLSN